MSWAPSILIGCEKKDLKKLKRAKFEYHFHCVFEKNMVFWWFGMDSTYEERSERRFLYFLFETTFYFHTPNSVYTLLFSSVTWLLSKNVTNEENVKRKKWTLPTVVEKDSFRFKFKLHFFVFNIMKADSVSVITSFFQKFFLKNRRMIVAVNTETDQEEHRLTTSGGTILPPT